MATSARLMAQAGAGVLCDEATMYGVTASGKDTHGVAFEAKGEIAVKGKQQPVSSFRKMIDCACTRTHVCVHIKSTNNTISFEKLTTYACR